nr:hypothetical protein [uncultured Pseudodesulfovibrio sp.]
MILTNLEATLIAGLIALVAGVVVPVFRGRKFVTEKDCKKLREGCAEECDKRQANDKDAIRTLYRMVRALVVHSDMSKEDKEKVLNDRGGEHD